MGTRKSGEQNIRSITQNRTGTYQISLPIQLIRELNWQQRQKVVVSKRGDKLIIRDWKK